MADRATLTVDSEERSIYYEVDKSDVFRVMGHQAIITGRSELILQAIQPEVQRLMMLSDVELKRAAYEGTRKLLGMP